MQSSPALPRPARSLWERPRLATEELRQALGDPARRPALLWRAFWAPFWLWSDAPVPELPGHGAKAPAELGLAGQAVLAGIDQTRRRMWVSHAAAALCRGIWLGLALAALLMLLDLAGGPVFNPYVAGAFGAVAVAAGLVLAALSRPSRQRTARMLDRSFSLQERLGTALDDLGLGVPGEGQRAPVVYLQMADAANAMAVLRKDRRLRPQIPVREVVLAVFCALVLTTLAFLRGLGGDLPQISPARVPVFTPAIERPVDPEPSPAELEAAMAPTVQEVLERSDRSSQARRDLQALAAALADHAIGRPAADQISRGDYDAAGERLREAAPEAGDLSPTAREELAGDLEQAASEMEPETNGLEEAARDAAAGLREGDREAEASMRDLADAVESAGSDVVPQGELASQMRSAQQAAAQSGESGSSQAAAPMDGEMSASAPQGSSSAEPGAGIEAQTSSSQDAARQDGAGADPGQPGEAQAGQSGEGGEAGAPVDGDQPGEGQSGMPGEGMQGGERPGGPQADGDASTSRPGGGAGTGAESAAEGERTSVSGCELQVGAGEDAADPNVVAGDGAEGDPAALAAANDQVALPTTSSSGGVQTSADGGSALRGSGAGVTAGAGFATQGEVGEAGPDSNRVPPRHRETVERYFSAGEDG